MYITNQNFKQIQLYTALLQGIGVMFLEQSSPLMFPEQYILCWHQSFEWFRKQTHKSVGWKCSTESSIMNIQTYLSTQSYSVNGYVLYSCILPVLYNLYFYVLASLWLNFGFMGVTHTQLTLMGVTHIQLILMGVMHIQLILMGVTHVQLKPIPWMLMDESITPIIRYHHRHFRQ